MILKPMVRNNICMNAHPEGCRAEVRLQTERVKVFCDRLTNVNKNGRGTPKPAHVLVIGCSTGYGLASRLVAAFGYGADTVGFPTKKSPQIPSRRLPAGISTKNSMRSPPKQASLRRLSPISTRSRMQPKTRPSKLPAIKAFSTTLSSTRSRALCVPTQRPALFTAR